MWFRALVGIKSNRYASIDPLPLPRFQVEKALAIHELSASTLHHTQGCSALDGQGLQPGLEKLHEMVLRRKKMQRHSSKKKR